MKYIFEKQDNNKDYIVFFNEKGFLNTRLLEINGKIVVNFDTIEVHELHRRKGVATQLIEQAIKFWGVSTDDIYFVAFGDESRLIKEKYNFGANIWL